MFINKLVILFLVLLIITFSLSASAQKDRIMGKIFAHYPLDGNLVDQGPHQLHGEKFDKTRGTEDKSGRKNAAIYFSGEGESITLPVNINPEKMPELTIALWLKVEKTTGLSPILTHSSGGFARSIIIDSRKSSPLLSVSAGSNQKLYGGIAVPHNKWFFTAVSWNAESGRVELYFIDQNKNFSVISTNNINPENGKAFITLGGNTAAGDFFIGSMDELMIWDQILTPAEIRSLAF